MTTYKAARELCGLSQAEAAEFHQVSTDTIKSWDQGKGGRAPSMGIWLELASLWKQIEDACDGASSAIEFGDVKALNNVEADLLGNELPTQGARKAAGAMALLVTLSEMDDE